MSNDNRKIITCSKDKKIKIFDWIKKCEIQVLTTMISQIVAIEITPDQKYLFSAGEDRQIRIWSMESW